MTAGASGRPTTGAPSSRDYQSYLTLLAQHFGQKYSTFPALADSGYNPSYVVYIHPAAGLGDEGLPYIDPSSDKAPPSFVQQLKNWASGWQEPQACQGVFFNGSFSDPAFAQDWDEWQECMLVQYQDDFGPAYNFSFGAPIIYSVNASPVINSAPAEQVDPVPAGQWAINNGMGIGQDGFSPGWAFDGSNYNPAAPTDANASAMTQIIANNGGPPTWVQLQPVASLTQYCWNSHYDGRNPASTDPEVYCLPYTGLPQTGPECASSPTECQLPAGWAAPTYLADCSTFQMQATAYLALNYYGATDLEIYHSDLDDPYNVPADNQGTQTPAPLTGVDSTLSDVQNTGSVPQVSSSWYTSYTPCPHNTGG